MTTKIRLPDWLSDDKPYVDIDDPRAIIECNYRPSKAVELETGCYRKMWYAWEDYR